MLYSIVIRDVLSLPRIADATVETLVFDSEKQLTHTDLSTDRSASNIESFQLEEPRGEKSGAVWVGYRLLEYQFEALLPKLKLRGTALALLVFSPKEDAQWREKFSAATRDLARRLEISIVAIRTQDSPMSVAAEVEELLRQNRTRQAKEIVTLADLAKSGSPTTPNDVGRALVDSIRAPVSILGPNDAIIWSSRLEEKLLDPQPAKYKTYPVTAPIGPSGTTRIEAQLCKPSAAEIEFVRPLLAIGGLLLAHWYFEQREATLQSHMGKSSLLSELAAVQGRVPSTLVSLASSVGWPLVGWHIVISSRSQAGRKDDEDGTLIAAVLHSHGFPTIAAQYLGHWVLCFSQTQQPEHDEYLRLIEVLENSFPSPQSAMVFGVSQPRFGPDGFVKNLNEAEDLIQRAGKGKVRRTQVNSRESTATKLVQNTVSDPALLIPAGKLLNDLLQPEHNHLLETLTVYLELESNLSRTARHLGLHRNTVISRISRIEHLLNTTLEQPDLRLALRIAIKSLAESNSY